MIDHSNNANLFGTSASASVVSDLVGKPKPVLDQEPAWKSEFRQTLEEIQKVGFSSYAADINEKKLQEIRAKVLASMGLTEDDLQNMSPEKREKIEKMVATEVQNRLSAEKALGNGDKNASNAPNKIANEINATPNGFGAMVLAMQEIDSTSKEQDQTR